MNSSDDGVTWTTDPTSFSGNVDASTPKENSLSTPRTNRFFRILPTAWDNYCSMRLEFVGCYKGCRDSFELGLESGFIHDAQMSASSYYATSSAPQRARLNLVPGSSMSDGWRAASDDSRPWLQVDFIAVAIVEGIKTQGRVESVMWVETYELDYGDDGYSFTEYVENAGPKIFNANTDSSSVVENLIEATVARFFRIKPVTWESSCGLRAEFIGCYRDCTSSAALGMEDGRIEKAQIDTSSNTNTYLAKYGRLNYDDTYGGWMPNINDKKPWFEVDFLKDVLITGIATQAGVQDSNKWMKTFKLAYSVDGNSFRNYIFAGQVLEFIANYDHLAVVKRNLPTHIYTRFIRIYPKTCKNLCVMRTEIYGCYEGINECASVTCQHSGTCSDFVNSFACICGSGYLGYFCDLSCPTVYDLGMADNSISDSQLTDSTVGLNLNPPSAARLHSTQSGWCADDDDHKSWIQVDFQKGVNIAIIKTQGQHGGDGFIRTFYVRFGNDGSTFQGYQIAGRTKVFKANEDSSSTVFNYFTPAINARYLRIHPLTFHIKPYLRMELSSCELPCTVAAAGMESTNIRDSQIKASSNYDGEYRDFNARLNHPTGWSPASSDYSNPWLEVDFKAVTTVTYVETQGGRATSYVKTFTVGYGDDGSTFEVYKENGAEKTFTGNIDSSTVVRNDFSPRISARYVRVNPKTHTVYITLRVEFYICGDACSPVNPCLNTGSCNLSSSSSDCICVANVQGEICENCSSPVALGIESGDVLDAQLSSSSEHESGWHKAKYARLNFQAVANVTNGGWGPNSNDLENPWLQIDFGRNTTLSAIDTQGMDGTINYFMLKQYQVSYSQDGVTFQNYIVNGNVKTYANFVVTDPDETVIRKFNPLIIARYVRFLPVSWIGYPIMRLELYGCKGVHYCLVSPCQNGGTCQETLSGYGCLCAAGFEGQHCEVLALSTTETPTQPTQSDPDTTTNDPPEISSNQPRSTTDAPPNPSTTTSTPLQTIQSIPSTTTSAPPQTIQSNPSSTAAANPSTQTSVKTTSVPVGTNTLVPSPTLKSATTTSSVSTPVFVLGISSSRTTPSLSVNPSEITTTRSAPVSPTTLTYSPISFFMLNPIPAQEFGQSISVSWVMTSGTDVSVSVTYNDIPCCSAGPLTNSGGQCACLISDSDLFDTDGVVNITAVASNSMSSIPASVEVEVLKIITQVSFTMLTSHSDFGSGVEGRGSLRNVFPAEHPVKFNSFSTGGPATTVDWTFICDVDGTLTETQYSFDKIFPSETTQSCQITLKVQNSINSSFAFGSIELKESVIFNSMTSNGPVKRNTTMTFTISLGKLGTDSCLWFDLGDNTSLLVFGDTSCASKIDVGQINPNIVTEPRLKFSAKSSDTQLIVINHVYPHVGSYDVRMNASNDVSMVTQDMTAVVALFLCHYPNVTITGLSPNSSNALNAVQVYRSLPISLTTENEADCEKTEQTKTIWTVFKFDDDPRVMNTTPISRLRKTPYHSDIVIQDLLLPGRDLPYGFYEITARVEMRGLPDVFGSDSIYIQVIQTPWLEAAVVGGSFYTAPFGFVGILNSSASSDPDVAGTDGMSFTWYCRDIEDNEFIPSNLTYEPIVSNDDHFTLPANASRGCFGSGRGRINTTNTTLQLDTNKMIRDKTYAILLVTSKNHPEFGFRQAITTIFFYVTEGIPPVVQTRCSKNCRDKIVADEKTILRSSCEAYCTGVLTFSWSIFLYDDVNTPEQFNLSSLLREIPQKELQNMVLNPINELDLAIKPDALQCGKKYTIVFRAIRPNGVSGELRSTVLVNEPPAGGKCTVSPSGGVALSTNFTFTCNGWTDPESPLTYEFLYGSNQSETLFYYRTLASGTSISFTDWLPAGEESSNYSLIVAIKVKDTYGSSSVEQFMIQVLPPSKGELNVTEISSSFEEYLNSGDTMVALSVASSLSSTLKTLRFSTSSADDATEKQKMVPHVINKKVLEEMLVSLAGLEPQDISSSVQVSGCLVLLTADQDRLTLKAQDAALTATESLAERLKNLSKLDQGFKDVKSAATNVIGTLGSMNDGSAKDSGSRNKTAISNSVGRTIGVVEKLQGILLDYLVSNEGSSSIETEQLSIDVEKISANALGEKTQKLKNSRFKAPSGAAFGLGEVLSNPNQTFLHMQPVDVKLALFDKNPFTWDNSSQNVTSNVIDIVVESKSLNMSSTNLTEDISMTITRDPSQFIDVNNSFYLKPDEINSTSKTKEYLKFHCFTRRSNYTGMNFEVKPENLGIHLNVYLKKGGKPDVKTHDYEFSYNLPDFSTCKVGNESVYTSHSQSNHDEALHIDPSMCSNHPYTVFVSNLDFNGTGEYCFAVQHIEQFHNETYPDPETPFSSRHARSVSCEVGTRRVRRSCVIIPPTPPKPTGPPGPEKILVADNLGFHGKFFYPNQTPNYNLTMFESSCIFWDVVNETWKGEGCRVALGTNRERIVCYCNHLTSFGSDLLVAPNPIDFDSVFGNFGSLAENVAVLALISTILGVYIIGVIWARRADKRDSLMVGPTILEKPGENYYYLVTTATGSRQGAGTTAKVVFTMSGDQNDTLSVWLHDRERPCFQRGQTNSFVISYPQGVGDLSYIQIWHDNSGSSPSWYLSRFSVKDLQTGKTWKLICENWLAVESEDSKVCRILPVANEQELTNFNHLFSKRAIKGLADGHIWFSIVSRPPTSNFTRVQRLSCALCLLCCTMITSAMFYNMGGQGSSPFAVHIGSLVIDLKPFVIGLQSSVIIIPVNVLLVQIFRNLRPKKEKSQRKAAYYEVDKDGADGESVEKGDDFSKKEDEVVEGVQIENQSPPKGKLPYCFIYLAYAMCYLVSAASVFFTLLYSIQWGKETSTEWVIAMVTSFFQSVLLLQPIKVVLAAVVFAVLIKKADDREEEQQTEGLVIKKPNEDKQVAANNLAELERKMEATSRPPGILKKFYRPPDPGKLQKAREKRLKELKMNAALKEIFAFFVFLILLMNVAQYHRNPDTYLLTKTLYETFEEVDAYGIDLSAISDGDSLWMWARETLIPGLYANEWYNGRKAEKGWLANMEDYLVGVPRVRLLRVEKDSCTVSSYFEDVITNCYSDYSVSDEEINDYKVSWETLSSRNSRKRRDISGPETETELSEILAGVGDMEHNRAGTRHKRGLDPIMGARSGKNRRKKKRLLASAKPRTYIVNDNALLPNGKVISCLERWRHQTMVELRGFPYWGTIAMYSGSGYVANLGYDTVTGYTVVADLHSNGWLDIQTRAVFVEFTVYNANTNLFGVVSYFVEFPSSSSAVTKAQYQIARFYLHLNGGQTLAHVLVIFFMLYFLYREGKLVYKQRCAYFKGFWNWVEVILIISEFLLIVLFLARLYEVDRNLLQLRENPNDYVGFQYAGNADALMNYIIGILVFFYILRFLRLLRFNKNFLVIGKTLSRISAPILSFCLPFIAGFLAFGLLAFSVFGSELEDYSSFLRTMVTQFSTNLGDFDFEAIFMVNPTIATLYFFSFIGLNVMVLMNMFIAIINDSFAEVQGETAEIKNEFEIIDYVTAKIMHSFHEKFHRGSVAPVKEKKRMLTKKSKKMPPYEQFYTELDLRGKKLELLLDIVEKSLGEDELEEQKFFSVPKHKQTDLFFRILCLMETMLDEKEAEIERTRNDQSEKDTSCSD